MLYVHRRFEIAFVAWTAFVIACGGAAGPAGPPGPRGEDAPDDNQGTAGNAGTKAAGASGMNADRGGNGGATNAGRAGAESAHGDVGPAGPTGPQGESGEGWSACKWCSAGSQTYKIESSGYRIYRCDAVDGDSCGSWMPASACKSGESIRYVYSSKDEYGFSSLLPGDSSLECYDPKTPVMDDVCSADVDCGGTKYECKIEGTARACVERTTWISGSGTWDYMSDHFSWPLTKYWVTPSVTCSWGRSSYWHNQPALCTATSYVLFDAPEGGLYYINFGATLSSTTPLNTPQTNQLTLATNATAAAHAGAVAPTINEVVFTTLDFRTGGRAVGTWRISGKVGASNTVAAQGEFRLAFP